MCQSYWAGSVTYLFVDQMLQRIAVDDEHLVQSVQDGVLGREVAEASVWKVVFAEGFLEVTLLEVQRSGELGDVRGIGFGLTVEDRSNVPLVPPNLRGDIGKG